MEGTKLQKEAAVKMAAATTADACMHTNFSRTAIQASNSSRAVEQTASEDQEPTPTLKETKTLDPTLAWRGTHCCKATLAVAEG